MLVRTSEDLLVDAAESEERREPWVGFGRVDDDGLERLDGLWPRALGEVELRERKE